MVHPHHHAVVLVPGERREEAAVRDLERRIPDGLGQARDGGPVHDVAALDRDHLPGGYRLDRVHTLALDAARASLDGLRGDPGPDEGGTFMLSGRHATILAHPRTESAGRAVG